MYFIVIKNMKKSYTVTVEDEQVINFVEEMAKRYKQPKSRILLAGLYAFMKQQAIPNAHDLGLDLDLTYGDITELKTRMNQLEARMSEFHHHNPEKIPQVIQVVNRPNFDNNIQDDDGVEEMPF
jgi:hypothetical protein